MKAIVLLPLVLLAFSLQADEQKPQSTGQSNDSVAASSEKEAPDKLTRLLGIAVQNPQGEQLGTIKDLMLNLRDERIAYAVLGTGGFLGIGDRLIALPPNALSGRPNQKHLLLHADKESLKTAPSFDRNNWPEMADARWLSETGGQYAGKNGERMKEAAGAEPKPEEPAAKPEETAAPRLVRATELIGTTIRNTKGEKIGEIHDSGVDLKTGTVRYMVVRAAEVTGVGEKFFRHCTRQFSTFERGKNHGARREQGNIRFRQGLRSESLARGPGTRVYQTPDDHRTFRQPGNRHHKRRTHSSGPVQHTSRPDDHSTTAPGDHAG